MRKVTTVLAFSAALALPGAARAQDYLDRLDPGAQIRALQEQQQRQQEQSQREFWRQQDQMERQQRQFQEDFYRQQEELQRWQDQYR